MEDLHTHVTSEGNDALATQEVSDVEALVEEELLRMNEENRDIENIIQEYLEQSSSHPDVLSGLQPRLIENSPDPNLSHIMMQQSGISSQMRDVNDTTQGNSRSRSLSHRPRNHDRRNIRVSRARRAHSHAPDRRSTHKSCQVVKFLTMLRDSWKHVLEPYETEQNNIELMEMLMVKSIGNWFLSQNTLVITLGDTNLTRILNRYAVEPNDFARDCDVGKWYVRNCIFGEEDMDDVISMFTEMYVEKMNNPTLQSLYARQDHHQMYQVVPVYQMAPSGTQVVPVFQMVPVYQIVPAFQMVP